MSLDRFLIAANTKFKKSDKEIVDLLFRLRNIVGIQEFTLEDIHLVFTAEISEQDFFNLLFENECLNESFNYHCNKYGEHEIADSMPFTCVYCKEPIKEKSNVHHRIKHMFELNTDFIGELRRMEEEMLKEIIGEDFIPNFELLRANKPKLIPFWGQEFRHPLVYLPGVKCLYG